MQLKLYSPIAHCYLCHSKIDICLIPSGSNKWQQCSSDSTCTRPEPCIRTTTIDFPASVGLAVLAESSFEQIAIYILQQIMK